MTRISRVAAADLSRRNRIRVFISTGYTMPTTASDTSYSPPTYPDGPLLDLPTTFSTLTCLQRGRCPVSSLRNSQGPEFLEGHSLYYEVHGSPATAAAIAPHAGNGELNVSPKKFKNKMVFIMGLNSSCFSWVPKCAGLGVVYHV